MEGNGVVPNPMTLNDTEFERAAAIRPSARRRTIGFYDRKAMRVALDSRPRVTQNFYPGQRVCFWRRGKSQGFDARDGMGLGCA